MRTQDTVSGFEAKALFRAHQGNLIINGILAGESVVEIEGLVSDAAFFQASIGPFGVNLNLSGAAETQLYIDMQTELVDGEWVAHTEPFVLVPVNRLLHFPSVNPNSALARMHTGCFSCGTSETNLSAQRNGWMLVFTGDSHYPACPCCVERLHVAPAPVKLSA